MRFPHAQGVLGGGPGGWLGGKLVERLGISVEEGAHPDASSSLSGTAASGRWPSRARGGAVSA
ncbi:hypothetical protein [Lentzea sp. NPDC004782]|uniref:hypothetical protein n=1 Tax=Lentzea sp. NPDC004782 TaxID=3154458 RepID=UPI0033AE7559